MNFRHTSVLLEPSIEQLQIRPNGIYVDGTLGGGGHSYHIAERLTEDGRLIGIDRDEDAICAASKRLEPFTDRVTIVKNNYGNIREVLDRLEISQVDGILLRSWRILLSAGYGGAGLFLYGGCASGYAYGS